MSATIATTQDQIEIPASLDDQIEYVQNKLEVLIRKAETGEHWAEICKIEADELERLLRLKIEARSSGPTVAAAPVLQNTVSKMLADAQAHLRTASWILAKWRRIEVSTRTNRDDRMLHEAEADFLAALDRVWDVQCMTVASF